MVRVFLGVSICALAGMVLGAACGMLGGMGQAQQKQTLVVRGGRVIDPAAGVDQVSDVVIEEGRVSRVGSASKRELEEAEVIDAAGQIVCPGLIDPHVHLREPGQEEKETIHSGSAAAVAGGFTSVVCMANTDPAIDHAALIEFVYTESKRANQANVFPIGTLTKGRQGNELAEIGLMARAGAVGFSDDGDCVDSAAVMAKALAYVKMTGKVLMQHAEERSLIQGGSINSGATATRLGLAGRPAVAEALAIQRDITLNRGIGCRYHVQHLSTAEGVGLIRQARRDNQPVTAEVCPHHLLLSEEACVDYDTSAKMNPPLRTWRDIEALREGVGEGTITILGTDHAPHTAEDKAHEFAAAPSGIVGLETALGLYAKALIEPGIIDWPDLIQRMSLNPARLCGLAGKGALTPGFDADITIIDPHHRWQIDIHQFASKARNSPFHGWDVPASAVCTIVGGDVKWSV